MRGYVKVEEPEQIAFMDWINVHHKLSEMTIHIANERATTKWHGAKLKRMGVKSGVPDIFISIPQYPYHGLWIEMKPKKSGVVSQNQKRWLDMLNNYGYVAKVANGCDEAINITREYFKNSDII